MSQPRAEEDGLHVLLPEVATGPGSAFGGPTPRQRLGYGGPPRGENTLIFSPRTGSGKTLAALPRLRSRPPLADSPS